MKKYRTWKPTENFKLMELEQIVDEGNKAHEWAVKVVRHLKLRQIMDAHKLTAQKTADLLSVSLSTVQHWGFFCSPRFVACQLIFQYACKMRIPTIKLCPDVPIFFCPVSIPFSFVDFKKPDFVKWQTGIDNRNRATQVVFTYC